MKKTAQNDITGDWLQSKPNSKQFEENFDRIFRKHIKEHSKLHQKLAEYELDKSTGEVVKKDE
jgi:predicted small secreted protein